LQKAYLGMQPAPIEATLNYAGSFAATLYTDLDQTPGDYDYACNTTAEIKYDRLVEGEEVSFEFRGIDMNCTCLPASGSIKANTAKFGQANLQMVYVQAQPDGDLLRAAKAEEAEEL